MRGNGGGKGTGRLRVDEGDGQRAGERGERERERERDRERAARRLHGNEARRECDGNHGSRGFLSRTDLSVPLFCSLVLLVFSSLFVRTSSFRPRIEPRAPTDLQRERERVGERGRGRKVERAHKRALDLALDVRSLRESFCASFLLFSCVHDLFLPLFSRDDNRDSNGTHSFYRPG